LNVSWCLLRLILLKFDIFLTKKSLESDKSNNTVRVTYFAGQVAVNLVNWTILRNGNQVDTSYKIW
jgi:archaellum component FlaF (FlaF/FlaG flagellin family)